ncbi:MAG TPA: SBBP repeat-containing protein, partial [Thermoanaerobaculia bacterium]|nr:SBBP repeat-containing protein [Thermoanaerobaculia bacterium]
MPKSASYALAPAVPLAFLLTFLCIAPLDARPLVFEQNHGQTAAEVKFLARGDGYALFLTRSSAVMKLHPQREGSSAAVTMKLIGAAEPVPRGERPATARTSYFIGNDPARWQTDVPAYHAVRYPRVYRGIDLVYYGAHGEAEYDFELQPGADPRSIRLAFEGARAISISDEGELILRTSSGDVRQQRPFAYQIVRGEKKRVAADYVLRNGTEVAFRIGRYYRRAPLVIDPVVRYATYLGGNSEDMPLSVAVDAEGNSYVAGCTHSADFPGAPGARLGGADVFVTKLDRSGSNIIYTAFLGGSDFENNPEVGPVGSVAIGADGATYVTGHTRSADFPVTSTAAQRQYGDGIDTFVARIDTSLSGPVSLQYSTFLGGGAVDTGAAVTVDDLRAIYVTGVTYSPNFPVTAPAFRPHYSGEGDAFVTKIAPAGDALAWSTFAGGESLDHGEDIEVDAQGRAYVAAYVTSIDYPTVQPLQTAHGGFFRSNDGARTWAKRNSGLGTSLIRSIVFDPKRPNRVYAGTWRGMYRSLDGGETWQAVNSGLPIGAGGS